jgi:hypothetical protein
MRETVYGIFSMFMNFFIASMVRKEFSPDFSFEGQQNSANNSWNRGTVAGIQGGMIASPRILNKNSRKEE